MKHSMPLVSVGMPVYNGEQFIERAVNSIREQDYPNIEIVISDNCSTDSTAEICKRLAEEDDRIIYTVNETNIGAVPNFAKALERASGEYFMWAAYDDQWNPKCISLLQKELSAYPEAILAHSGIAFRDEDGNLLSEKSFPDNNNPNLWTCFETAMKCSSSAKRGPKLNFAMYGLYRTEMLQKAIPYVHDGAFWDRLFVILSAMIGSFRYTPEILYHRTLHNTGADQRYPEDSYARHVRESQWWRSRVVMSLWNLLWACPDIPPERKKLIPLVVWRFGFTQLLKRNPLRGRFKMLRLRRIRFLRKRKPRKHARKKKLQTSV